MPNKKIPRRLFINGDLHRILHVNRAEDVVTTWSYPEHKRKMYVWSDIQKRAQRAFSVTEVAKLLNRKRLTIDAYHRREQVKTPQRSYGISTGNPGKFFFSEDDVLALYDYLLTIHKGKPRIDKLVTPWNLPTRQELKAMLQSGTMVYIQDEKGNFIPAWRERV